MAVQTKDNEEKNAPGGSMPPREAFQQPHEDSRGLFILPRNDGSSSHAVLFVPKSKERIVALNDYPSVGNVVDVPLDFISFHREVNVLELSHERYLEELNLISSNDQVHRDVSLVFVLVEYKGEQKVYRAPNRVDFKMGGEGDYISLPPDGSVLILKEEKNYGVITVEGGIDLSNGHLKLTAKSSNHDFRPLGYFLRSFRKK